MEKNSATEYEYVSGGSPVIMTEKINGVPCAQYTAYIDRGGYNWKLYPKKLLFYTPKVRFCKKTVSVMNVTILPNPDFVFPIPEPTEKERLAASEKKLKAGHAFMPVEGRQLSIFEEEKIL